MSLETLKKKLDNTPGVYTFNFSNEDDREYLFEEFGGEEQLKSRYPALYRSYLKAMEANMRIEADKNSTINDEDFTGEIGKLFMLPVNQILEGNYAELAETEISEKDNVQITAPVSAIFIDTTKKVENPEPASGWLGVTVQSRIKDINSPDYLINVSEVVMDTNSYEGTLFSNPEEYSSVNNKTYMTYVDLTGVDPEGNMQKKRLTQKQTLGKAKYYTIADIKVDDPAPKNDAHKASNEIVMLYGRMNEQAVYNDADYKGDDFLNNVFSNGKVHLLIPMSGKIVFDYNVEPIELYKPGDGVFLSRSKASYDYKQQNFVYRSDITKDTDLYDKLKGCFTKDTYAPTLQNTVKFDIKIADTNRSVYDWHTDVEGIQDGNAKTVMLNGIFTYYCKNQLGVGVQEQISIKSITPEDLINKKREYYTYMKGTNTIYIPPITIYWGCFGKDVKVLLEDGKEKYVSEVKSGDKLIGQNHSILTVEQVFTGHDTEIFHIVCDNGSEIKVSGGHPMMCEGQCVRACNLIVGDQLNLADGSLTKIISKDIIKYDDMVYNFTFEGMESGSYIIANGFYSGDLKMQNEKKEKVPRIYSDEEKLLMAEMMLHAQEMKKK